MALADWCTCCIFAHFQCLVNYVSHETKENRHLSVQKKKARQEQSRRRGLLEVSGECVLYKRRRLRSKSTFTRFPQFAELCNGREKKYILVNVCLGGSMKLREKCTTRADSCNKKLCKSIVFWIVSGTRWQCNLLILRAFLR